MNLKNKLKELDTYEKEVSALYPKLTQFEVLQIAVSLMNCDTKEQVHNYITKL